MGGVKQFFTPFLPQSIPFSKAYGSPRFQYPQAFICALMLSFLHFRSSPTSKYPLPSSFSFPLWYFDVLVVIFFANFMRQFVYESMLWLFDWGLQGVALGLPLILLWIGMSCYSPLLIFTCLNMHPPTVRWNASMTFACVVLSFERWNNVSTMYSHCLVCRSNLVFGPNAKSMS